MKIVNWNVEWASPRSPRWPQILRRLEAHEPEVACLTEAGFTTLPWEGHVVCSLPDYGYKNPKNRRRKVFLWSREPWRDVDQIGDSDMPPGRFVRATTQTSAGDLTVAGVCIPWRAARTGPAFKPRRKMWEDHFKYLDCLGRAVQKSRRRAVDVSDRFSLAIQKSLC